MSPRQQRPHLDSLLNMVARAADGRLLPREADYLRDALRAGEAARSSAAGMQAALTTIRRDLRSAEDELAVRRQNATVPPGEVTCPFCGAQAGGRCHNHLGPTRFHQSRYTAARGDIVTAKTTGPAREAVTIEAAARYAAGDSIRAIAATMNRKPGFIRTLLVESGVELRPPGGDTRSPAARAALKAGAR
jgi:hypothetical protein